jgi:hypothetical protein
MAVSLVGGKGEFSNPLLTIKGRTTGEINAQIALNTLAIKGFSYWNYFFKDALTINDIILDKPKITYYHNRLAIIKNEREAVLNSLKNTLSISELKINDAYIEVFDVNNDSLLLKTEHMNFNMSALQSNASTKQSQPFDFDTMSITIDSLYFRLGEFENLYVDSIKITNKKALLYNICLKTGFSKTALSNIISTERDHFDLNIFSLEIQKQKLLFQKNRIAGFSCDALIINEPDFNIYRDKTVTDDLTQKDLYGKMLRELDFVLDVNEIRINDGEITYEEKVKPDHRAGQLQFLEVNAQLKNVSNLHSSLKPTEILINSNFMVNTPLKVNWTFDVDDVNDNFVFKADIGMLKAEHLNQFMQPNLNIELNGELIQTYFTVDGNANISKVDLKTDYDDFDLTVLNENGKEKNEFLSGLINIFISKDSKDKPDYFRQSNTKTVERDKTKSIFNFVWKNAKSGLVSAMTGDGKKDN